MLRIGHRSLRRPCHQQPGLKRRSPQSGGGGCFPIESIPLLTRFLDGTHRTLHHLGLLLQLCRSSASIRVKRKIVLSWLQLFVLRTSRTDDQIANIAGFKVRYKSVKNLRFLFREVFLNQEYHFHSDRQSPVIMDCGSNIGMSVLYFKLTYPHSTILAFEPNPDSFACLRENIELNSLQQVTSIPSALGGAVGECALFVDDSQSGSIIASTRPERLAGRQKAPAVLQVQSCRLSQHIDQEIDFLKLDVEGAEFEVIQELFQSGKLSWIGQIGIEYHHHIEAGQDALGRLLLLLEEAGFGYQIAAKTDSPGDHGQEQDIFLLAYRKAAKP